ATSGGGNNTAVGYNSGLTVTTGSASTFVGAGADANAATYTNCASFGYATVVTASNKIFFGNSAVSGCYNAANIWAAQSDMRFKTNIKEDVKGLDFIKRLRPVTYNMDTRRLTEFMTQNMVDSWKFRTNRPHLTA
ncbi:MAG: tail fiber domain-containing protein, partial [Flavisolibacter sp.]